MVQNTAATISQTTISGTFIPSKISTEKKTILTTIRILDLKFHLFFHLSEQHKMKT